MRPGDTVSLTIYRQTAAAAPSTGKVLADFSFDSYLDGVSTATAKTLSEIGSTTDGKWRAYKLNVTVPGTAGRFSLRNPPASGTDIVYPDTWEGEIEAQDIDSIASLTAYPVSTVSATGAPTVDTPLVFDAYRYHDCTATRYNAAGTPLDLTGYTNARFSVWTKDHSSSIYTLSSGITLGGAAGTISWSVPETASFFSQIDAAITASQDTVTLYYDLVADKGGLATQTVMLLRGTVTLRRYESPA